MKRTVSEVFRTLTVEVAHAFSALTKPFHRSSLSLAISVYATPYLARVDSVSGEQPM